MKIKLIDLPELTNNLKFYSCNPKSKARLLNKILKYIKTNGNIENVKVVNNYLAISLDNDYCILLEDTTSIYSSEGLRYAGYSILITNSNIFHFVKKQVGLGNEEIFIPNFEKCIKL